MNRIASAFQNKKAFIGFITAGDPDLSRTPEFILQMVRGGADLIEVGIPFSDPIAEGPVIQDANVRALSKGCTTDQVFDMVKEVRRQSDVPIVFMTYLNVLFKYGYEKFCDRCVECGADGMIIPDMPYEEREELLPIARAHDLRLISMIAPTSKERIRMIAKEAEGFIYVVSSMGVTGMRNDIKTDIGSMIEEIRAVTDTPAAVGFGIHTRAQVEEYEKIADGSIVGSAIVRIIAEYGENAGEKLYDYVAEMTGKR
ncbi:MAG: tryptophan synthase subunit alpha [Lachnospiraceae bacterium]|nr:tryptophan synthase subunit alpha [Lachnospiraceae bacterium]